MLRLARSVPRRGTALSSSWLRVASSSSPLAAAPPASSFHSARGLADTLKPYEHNLDNIIQKRAIAAKRELTILAEAFMRYDGDRKGHLDRDQIFQVLKDLELPQGEVEVGALFERLDENNDGAVQLTEWLDHLPKGTRLRLVEKYGSKDSTVDGHRVVRMSIPTMSRIVYTHTDEAPMLATFSLLPIIRSFTRSVDLDVELRDISVAGRILANFPDYLQPDQRVDDELSYLGDLAKTPTANIIKLPNISASIPQLTEAIEELQQKGFNVPDLPLNPSSPEEEKIRNRYNKVLGSAVNPVLREGNSDRRVALPVKAYAQKNPHRMGKWSPDSKSHVAHMSANDFFGGEKSMVMPEATSVRIEHVAADGTKTVLKATTALQKGEVIDATRMDVAALRDFFEEQISAAKDEDVLLSLHLKATMMKVSDPIMFGHCVKVFYKDVFAKHAQVFEDLGVNANNGLGDVYAKIKDLPADKQAEIEADIQAVYETRPRMAMVDSDRGITNLHAPNDIIIDASVPPVIRDGGKMWGPDGELHDTKMLIPDRCYAGMYEQIVEDCRTHGAFDVSTMGNVANVGLMAQKAQEYGSHDKTFEVTSAGVVRVVDTANDAVLFEHQVGEGDIWRMCQTKDSPIQDWVKLAVSRAKASGSPAVFWLNEQRAHDASLIGLVTEYLKEQDTSGIEVHILPPEEAMRFTLARCRAGKDTISVTGNVLRDYLTDLFPIIELGTSAKMLSIVPLLAGGGLFETGAGGSAPKHVQQLVKENHLRWDSLGEFLALAVSIEDLASKTDNDRARLLADCLNTAVGCILDENKSPLRKVNELDNRGSHFWLALYWARAVASQTSDASLAEEFRPYALALEENQDLILEELNAVQGNSVDLGGYYHPDPDLAEQVMRPSATFNRIVDSMLESDLACHVA